MKNRRKQSIIYLLVLVIMVGCFSFAAPQEKVRAATATNTSGSFDERISQLQKKFPAGKYWNHMDRKE